MRSPKYVASLTVLLAAATVLSLSVPGVRWRVQFVALKTVGEIPDLGWGEVLSLIAPGSGVWAGPIWTKRNPYLGGSAPEATRDDIEAGGRAFQRHCSMCHGTDARGDSGPELLSGRFRSGVSDLALFQTIRRGVPATTMRESDLDSASVWQIVAYLRETIFAANAPREAMGEGSVSPIPAIGAVTSDELTRSRAGFAEWLTHYGAYDGQRHSRLKQINRGNAERLAMRWVFQIPGDGASLQTTPLVVGSTMFVNLPEGEVWALDVRTGETLWHHPGRSVPADLQQSNEGVVSRGMAVLGTTLFVPTIDAHLMAVDARSGKLLWNVEVADYNAGYSLVGAPLAVGDRIIVGVAGSDRGIRGFLAAFLADSGRRVWRFDTVPGPEDPAHETWGDSDAWERGGGLTATTGTYDPELGLIYWGVGNPSPAFQGGVRPGKNLYTSSVIAIEAASGHLRWHYQIAPHDERDWGVTHVPLLVDDVREGTVRKLLYLASRNGFLYTLDRRTGQFLQAKAYVRQTWNAGFDVLGQAAELPNSRPTREGTLVYPGHAGATNWMSPSYDPASGLLFVVTRNGYGNVYHKSRRLSWPDGAYWGGRAEGLPNSAVATEIRAIVASTGELRWTYRFPGTTIYSAGGVLSTDGGLVFAGEKGRFVAVDLSSGRELWHFSSGGMIDASPITYLDEGQQHVSIAAGRVIFTFSIENP